MSPMNDTVVELTTEELKTIVGGGGVFIDPNGGTSPTGGNTGDGGGCIDPNG